MQDDAARALTRREFVVTSLAAGFAAAVLPVAAGTLAATDAQDLEAGEVAIPVAGGELPAYRAMPARGAVFPVVVVVQEIFGVHEYIKDVCRRLAKLGYFAVAPSFFARQGDVTAMSDTQEIIAKVVSKVPDAQVMGDIDATAAWAAKTGKGDPARFGITGFCWGGRIVWLYAAHSAAPKAGVAWYGRLSGASTPLQPKYPLEVAAELKAPVLGLYGGADAGIPLAQVEQMRAALKTAGSQSEIVVYPEAPHAFHADYRASYRPADAVDGWQRMLQWFQRFGVAPRQAQ
jgi:carboxymethylenebutenolidase